MRFVVAFTAWVTTWLRSNSERYLLADAQEQMAQRYLGRSGPVGVDNVFWRRVFVPLYKVLPWRLRHAVMIAMPGSHRAFRASPPPPRGDLPGPHSPEVKG